MPRLTATQGHKSQAAFAEPGQSPGPANGLPALRLRQPLTAPTEPHGPPKLAHWRGLPKGRANAPASLRWPGAYKCKLALRASQGAAEPRRASHLLTQELRADEYGRKKRREERDESIHI